MDGESIIQNLQKICECSFIVVYVWEGIDLSYDNR